MKKPSDLRSHPYMLQHKEYREDWRDVGIAIAIGLILGALSFSWLAT